MNKPVLSLCMPTNGVIEWVFPVLESIYCQNVDETEFEVIITDNGDNKPFKEKIIEYKKNHTNLEYKETDALPFLNEIESYKCANGKLIKFVNHRTKLIFGALEKLIDFAKKNSEEKPIVYFANGVLQLKSEQYIYPDFNEFVKNLSYWSSWSTGMTIWKEDFERLPENTSSFNELFPHTTVLFNERNRGKYIIDNSMIFDELPQGKKKKGDYDLFQAFGIEYPGIICDLLRDGDITSETFRTVVKDNLYFIATLYFNYCIRKQYCSYYLEGFKDIIGIFYSKRDLKNSIYKCGINKVFTKLKGTMIYDFKRK